jgi:hypothetical protein
MTKTYKFKTIKNNNSINNGSFANYSEILDNIIAADVKKKNSYLIDNTNKYFLTKSYTFSPALKDSDEFTKAAKFLANYKDNYSYIPNKFIYGKMYTLSDGTPIVFYDDEIQIGFNVYKYTDFTDLSFLDTIGADTKKIIINIYGNANVKINLL